MRRFAALLAALALALLCAGGFAMPSARAESAEPTHPPLRHVLDISFSVSPAELVEPGEATLTFTITNASEYDAENVYISSSDGLHTEPLGQIEAGGSRVFSRAIKRLASARSCNASASFIPNPPIILFWKTL